MKGSVLIVGGGVAGMRAAAELLQQRFRVYVVEAGSSIGGILNTADRLPPAGDHASCALQALRPLVVNDPNSTIFASSEILSLEGVPGDFIARVRRVAGGDSDEMDLAVGAIILATPCAPDRQTQAQAGKLGVELHGYGSYGPAEGCHPILSSRAGVFVCRDAHSPEDVSRSVVQACAAASRAAVLLAAASGADLIDTSPRDLFPVKPGDEPGIAVVIDEGEGDVRGILDPKNLAEYTRTLPGVLQVEVTPDASNGSTIRELLCTRRFNRLVVAGPSPVTHEHVFQRHAEEAGLNRFLVEVVNLHDQCARVHSAYPEEAARKARVLIKMGVARARRLEPLEDVQVGVVQSCLVVGGAGAGVSCAWALAGMGFEVHLVEDQSGPETAASVDDSLVGPLLAGLRSRQRMRLHAPAAVGSVRGCVGGFTVDVIRQGAKESLQVGAIVVASARDELFQGDCFEASLALAKDGAGHYMAAEGILNPLDSVTAGVFLCGPARADLTPADALLDGEAAASRAACVISCDVMRRPPVMSQVVDENCDGCAYCVEPCPTRSITLLEYILGGETRKVIEVSDATCIGCGICMATCPKDGAFVRHYRPESFTDMIRAVLEEDAESGSDLPVVIGFCCNRCAYPGADSAASAGIQYPPGIRIIRPVCLGMIHPNIVMDALSHGADGVLLCGCYEGECRSREGIRRALARREGIRLLMEDFGLEQARFRLEHIAAAEGLKFARVVEEMTGKLAGLGPSPYKGA